MHIESNYSSNISIGQDYDRFQAMDHDVRKTQEWLELEEQKKFNQELLNRSKNDDPLRSQEDFN